VQRYPQRRIVPRLAPRAELEADLEMWALTEHLAAERRRVIAAAKVQIGRSGERIGQEATQLHGGIGMTMEYKVGHYFKHMTIIGMLYGDRGAHLATLARLGGLFGDTKAA